MTSIRRLYQRFRDQVRGNVTITVALSIVPIAAAIGGGVDFANVENARAHLQDAADSAAIAATLDSTGTLQSRTNAANKSFSANIAGVKNLTTASGTLGVTSTNNITTMAYTATARVPTYVLDIVGIRNVNIQAVAKAGVSINKAEIAFVLDNTGSMSSNNKMTQLKSSLDATLASLLDSNGVNSGHTKVALVPFDTQVALNNVSSMTGYAGNFGSVSQVYTCSGLSSAQCDAVTSNASSLCSWISSNWSASAASSCASTATTYTRVSYGYYYVYTSAYFNNPYYGSYCYNCGSSSRYISYYRVQAYSLGTSSANSAGYSTINGYYQSWANAVSPSYAGYNYYTPYTGTVSYAYPTAGGYGSTATTVYKDNDTITSNDDLLGVGTENWSGCVIDRAQPYDVQADAPTTSNAATLYPASKCATNSLLPIMDLTEDISSARTYAQRMTPAGNTNITIGIQWGMEVLSPTAPFTGGAQFSDKTVNKYMIVLTDGLNTQNRWTTTSSSIDARTALACAEAKRQNITVFTVRLEQGNSSMLQACASQTSYYYNLSNANQISGALGSIMKSIKKVRLTQ